MKLLLFLALTITYSAAFAGCSSNGRNFQPNEYVFVGTKYKKAARIVSIDLTNSTAVVQSLNSGKQFTERCEDFYAGSCIRINYSPICYGYTVWKGAKYREGAEVVIFHEAKNKVLVRSNWSNELYVEDISALSYEFIDRNNIGYKDIVAVTAFPKATFKVKGSNPIKQTVTIEDERGNLSETSVSKLSLVGKNHHYNW